jgi:hypothetical protein
MNIDFQDHTGTLISSKFFGASTVEKYSKLIKKDEVYLIKGCEVRQHNASSRQFTSIEHNYFLVMDEEKQKELSIV